MTLLLIQPLPTGMDPKENHQALEYFKKFVQRKGFTPENIIVPEQRGEQVTLEFTH